MHYANWAVEEIKKSHTVFIYGAGTVGKEVYYCLTDKAYNVKIDGFMVSNVNENPEIYLGQPVISIEDGKKYDNPLILVAVIEKFKDEILKSLDHAGYSNILELTFESDLWSELRGNFLINYFEEKEEKYLTLEEELEKCSKKGNAEELQIYMAKCHRDKKVNVNSGAFYGEIPIQVGAGLTDQIIAEVRDNMGEQHISDKNPLYCELTASYWAWHNSKSKYVGLCHYRRHFELNFEQASLLVESDIDVVLTIPILNFPSVRDMYYKDHCKEDWNIMLEAIEKLKPNYLETAYAMQEGIYYYGYNMLIARKEIFDDYCEWLFTILDYCEEHCSVKADRYQNRFLGFLGERLLSIYFMHNREKYKIVHAKKKFIS